MRSTRLTTALVAAAAAAIALTGCGGDGKATSSSSSSSSSATYDVEAEAAAITASEKTIREGLGEREILDPFPKSLFTEQRVEEKNAQIATAKKEGQRSAGEVDKVVSIETESTSFNREPGVVGGPDDQVASTVCVERNSRWLDKKGKDMRGNQEGEPIKAGSKVEFLVRTVPGDEEGTWLIDTLSEKGPCK